MSDGSTIEWTEATWNPVTGCTKVSPGCAHCYAETFAERFRGVKGHPYEMGFDLTLRPERLELPLTWKRPRRIFVNSMSDLFHPDVPDDFVQSVFRTMERATWHEFQVLTKRPERAAALAGRLPWPSNIWLGTSVENQRWVHRVDALRRVPAAVRFLSCEPLLGSLQLDLQGISWVIVGGESGGGARPMRPEWARSIQGQCADAGVAFFFKQWGAHNDEGRRVGKGKAGRTLDGRVWSQYPVRPGKSRECHPSEYFSSGGPSADHKPQPLVAPSP
ncbi:MAG: phage Gp37/Gp68 family protein [Dehalococcoidia bacterium]|nr:phage Gp37/Gp68 family protein [Dehalococcoidia bacterium]